MGSVTEPGQEPDTQQTTSSAHDEVKEGLIKPGQELALGFTVCHFLLYFLLYTYFSISSLTLARMFFIRHDDSNNLTNTSGKSVLTMENSFDGQKGLVHQIPKGVTLRRCFAGH